MGREPVIKEEKSRIARAKKGLSAIFATVAVMSSIGGVTAPTVHPPAGEPETIQAFGAAANFSSLPPSVMLDWTQMMQRQQKFMQNPKDAAQFNAYLAQFDQYKGESYDQMTRDVNAVVKKIPYSDTVHTVSFYYWATPYETETQNVADCKAYAILQYTILRHLGVPADRLFIAMVRDKDQGHAILLVNTAPDGQKPNFVTVGEDGVHDAKDFTPPGTKGNDAYELYVVLNEQGFWVRDPGTIASTEAKNLERNVAGLIKQAPAAWRDRHIVERLAEQKAKQEAARLEQKAVSDIAKIPKAITEQILKIPGRLTSVRTHWRMFS